MAETLSGARMAAVKDMIVKINESPLSPGLLSVCGEKEDRAICQMVVGETIDYFSFSMEALETIVSAMSVPGTVKAEKVTNGYRHTGRERVSLCLTLEAREGQSVFSVTIWGN